MPGLYLAMLTAGMLTILLPCILPLVPIVLGVSIAGRSRWRPLLTIAGMLVSFVGFTFLLTLVLNRFIVFADVLRISTYYALLLFGLGFLTHNRYVQLIGAVLGGFFFWKWGWIAVTVAQTIGAMLMEVGGWVATRIQQLGSNVQQKTQEELGRDNPLSAFIMGLTLGLVWVPCAGPALGFAFTLVREQPGLEALALLTTYGIGTGIPLLLIGYGGQRAVHSTRALTRYSGRIKQISGAILIVTALLFQFNLFREIEIYLVNNTSFGNLGVDIETKLFGEDMPEQGVSSDTMNLPKISRAPLTFAELGGDWLNSTPLTPEDLKGKVVLVDFWTYSCINCIRTLPYIQGYWDKYKDSPFVLIGVHTPEFVFEKNKDNVQEAINRHGLTYPVVQDNDFEIWRSYSNRYWPAKYLIDASGYIRYTHFGEGAYEETDTAIESLLKEIGVDVTEDAEDAEDAEVRTRRGDLTPETYLGARSWPALQNAQGDPSDDTVSYEAPETLQLHRYALDGDWQLMDNERQVLRSEDGEIRVRFLGGEINLVFGAPPSGRGEVEVEVDGEIIKTFTVDFDDLYELWKGEYGEHEIVIRVRGAGTSAYAFTFGQ